MKSRSKHTRKSSKNSQHNLPIDYADKHYRSFSSNQKIKKQHYSSYLFQNVKNSLCGGSPKISKVQQQQQQNANNLTTTTKYLTEFVLNNNNNNASTHQKYKNYMQFMQSGKITPDSYSKRNSFVFQNKKNKAITPTPRRNSLQYTTERKRLSILKDFNNMNNINSNNNTNNQEINSIRGRGQGSNNKFKNIKEKNHEVILMQKMDKGPRQKQKQQKKKSNINNQLYIKGKIVNTSNGKIEKNKQKQKQKQKDKHKIKKKSNEKISINQQQTTGRRTIQSRKSNHNKQKQKKHINQHIHRQSQMSRHKNNEQPQLMLTASQQKLQQQQALLLSKLFKGIEFHRDLGKGAHALVKSAVDWVNNRKIAIKIYTRSLISPQQLKNIQRQVQILMRLQHDNIVKLYEIVQSYKTINLVMEYGGGNSLEQFIRSKSNGRLEEGQACVIFTQVLKAVGYLETAQIVHRDIKPENILLNKYLNVKLIDFGFSLLCPKQTQIIEYYGTPTYMAPEIVSKLKHNPHLADRWSLGVLLFTMLNGGCPFKATSQKQLFQKIIKGQYYHQINLSDESRQLVDNFLVYDPVKRISAQNALKSRWVEKFIQKGL